MVFLFFVMVKFLIRFFVALGFFLLNLNNQNIGGFHLYLFELAFINQFYSRKTRLVQLSLAND